MLAFGIFFTLSCSTLENTETHRDLSAQENYNNQLRDINLQIEGSPNDRQLKSQKAEILINFASSYSDPFSRKPLYVNLRELADEADGSNPAITNTLKKAWNNEQNSAVRLLQKDDSDGFDDTFHEIIAHFDNAITIIPDSLVTYRLKANTLYKNGSLHDAIQTLETAKANTGKDEAEIDEKIAYLNLESGNLNEAVVIYSSLADRFPDNEHFKHGLINALIINEQHEAAVELLQELSEKYPTRFFYRESLATETYFLIRKELENLLIGETNSEMIRDDLDSIYKLLDEAHTLFTSLSSQAPVQEENTLRMAAFYKNSASIIDTIINELELQNEEKEIFEDQYIQFLEHALPAWERLAELNPGNIDYLINLREVYQNLGMDDDAEAVERSLNF